MTTTLRSEPRTDDQIGKLRAELDQLRAENDRLRHEVPLATAVDCAGSP